MTSARPGAFDPSASSKAPSSCRRPTTRLPCSHPPRSHVEQECHADRPVSRLEMRTRGSLSGPCDVLDTLLSPRQPKDIDPRRYGFRMFATVKSPDKRYAEIVNCGLWTASGVWSGDELIIE